MPIVLISEALLRRQTVTDGRLLRDRVLCEFCERMNPRKRTFRISTIVDGKQFRMTLGYWPLMSLDEARAVVERDYCSSLDRHALCDSFFLQAGADIGAA